LGEAKDIHKKTSLEIKLPHENLSFLNSWPKLTIERYLAVFSLIEAELPNSNETETVDITISNQQFERVGVIDFLNVLMAWEEKIGVIHCKHISGEGYTKISMFVKDLDIFDKIGNALKEALIKNDVVGKAKYSDGIIFFGGKKIDFNKAQNQRYLLKILFKNVRKNWHYDEIAGDSDWDETGIDVWLENKPAWKKFYSAGDDINKAVAVETGIKDFIIKNTKEIRINPKYLSK